MKYQFYRQYHSFFAAGLVLVLAVLALVIFSYLLIAAALVGAVFFFITWVRTRFFGAKQPQPSVDHASSSSTTKRRPVTFEHGEY